MSTAPAEKDRVVDMLGSEASALSKYQSVFVGREGLLATLKYDLVMMLASGTRCIRVRMAVNLANPRLSPHGLALALHFC